MIVKSISHEQRKAAAVKRAAMQRHGQEPPLRRVPTKAQAAHVVATSRYFMRPSKTGEKALGIEGHRVHRTTEYLVGDKDGSAGKERLLHVAHRNFASTDLAGQQAEMIALMSVAPGRDDAFEHLVISPGHGVVPSRRQMDVVPGRLLELLGAGDHQAFCVWHGDTRNIHGHVGVSRVDPATGRRVALGERWLLDTLGQAIAQIEHEQGWPAEANAHYRADARGVFRTATGEQVRDAGWNRVGPQRSQAEKRAQDAAHGKVKLSTGATEYERHQRLWSDERAAQAIAWPVIRDAGSWDALHSWLAAEGIRYEKKGSGARIVIGERDLTATTANWAASIAKLTPRLGDFAPRAADVEVAPYVPRRLDGADQRAAHKGAKASAAAQRDAERADIARAANDAVAALTREHRRLQRLVNDTSWSGRGEDLELARKLVGIVHRDARDAVEELRRETDRAARDLYRFPGFEAWLRDGFLLDDEEEEGRERRRRARFGLILGFDGRHLPPAILLPGYEVEDDELERRYSRDGRLRFIDHGNRIEMADALDRETVRDALLVAQAKWGKVQLTGDRRFRELAADIAVELGVEIANPELQTRIAQVQRQQERLRARDAQTADHLRRRAAVVTAQWPLLREQDGRVVVDKATRERFRLGVGTMCGRPSVGKYDIRLSIAGWCGHVSDLLVRRIAPLAVMPFARLGSRSHSRA